METYTYTYLFMGLAYFIVWLILFLLRKDLRKEMFILSLLFAPFGPLSDLVYTQDWWHPITLSGTTFSIEPLLVGFSIGGIASVIYDEVFGKRVYFDSRKVIDWKMGKRFFAMELLAVALFFGIFYLLELNSLISSVVAFAVVTIIILYHRKDLFWPAVLSGILLCLVASFVYWVLNLLTPDWIEHFWVFRNTHRLIIGSLPIDDVVWYFSAGMMIGPLYEYYRVAKLR